MIVNFLFDYFIEDDMKRPWWNMPPYYPDTRNDLKPYNRGWWHNEAASTILNNNPLGVYENEIRFVKTLEHELNAQELNIYPLHISDKEWESADVLLRLPAFVVDRVNAGLLKLLIINYFEMDPPEIHSKLYYTYKYKLSVSKINNFHNVFIVGNSPLYQHKINTEFATDENGLKYVTSHSYEKFMLNELHQNKMDDLSDRSSSLKSHIFLMQMNYARFHKYLFAKYFAYLGVLDFGLYSYRPTETDFDCLDNYKNDYIDHNLSSVNIIEELEADPYFSNWLNHNLLTKSKKLPNSDLDPIMEEKNLRNHNFMSYMDKSWLDDTYFSVVAETSVNSTCFITEKTFKLLYYGHPFIILGSPGILRELQSLGYQTFPELFDESYDDMTFSYSKIKFITEQVKKWCDPTRREELIQVMRAIQPKLEHNRKVFTTKDHTKIWNNFKY